MDVSKSQFLNAQQLKYLLENYSVVLDKEKIKQLKTTEGLEKVKKYVDEVCNSEKQMPHMI